MKSYEKKAEATVLRMKLAEGKAAIKEYYTYLRKVCTEIEIHEITQLAMAL